LIVRQVFWQQSGSPLPGTGLHALPWPAFAFVRAARDRARGLGGWEAEVVRGATGPIDGLEVCGQWRPRCSHVPPCDLVDAPSDDPDSENLL